MENIKSIKSEAKGNEGVPKAAFASKVAAPALGNMLKGIVPEADADGFMAFTSGKPRLRELVAKKKLTKNDKERLEAAYAGYLDSKKQTAIVKREAATLAPLLGVSEEKAGNYLEVYNPDQLKRLALVAQREELETGNVVDADMALMFDGSYLERDGETVTVSTVHAALTKLIGEELKTANARNAVQAQDVNLDNLWDVLVKKHDGDEEKAAAEYAEVAETMITGAKTLSKMPQYQLDMEKVLELFKLFDYNREDISTFLEYVEHHFSLEPEDTAVSAEKLVFGTLLGEFVKENATGLSLNDRSTLFKSIKAKQVQALIDDGRLDKSAAIAAADAEIDDEREEDPAEAAKKEEPGIPSTLIENHEDADSDESLESRSEEEDEED